MTVNRATLAGIFGGEFADIFDAVMGEQIGASAKKIRGLGQRTIDLREAIIETFEQCEKPVTVRQMFYQLTVRGAIPKTEAGGYRPVQRQLVLMRREGLIPYDWIADNTRWMRKPTTYRGLHDFFARSARYYRQDLWIDSDVYVEVWCEKDALAGVIAPITSEYDVPLMVARGFASESFLYSTAENIRDADRPAYIYHVGDFDPSGWEASRDIESRLKSFDVDVHFERLGVNPEHIEKWNLPSRPTKTTDTRCKRFFEEHGEGVESVELDALHPDTLRALVREAIERHIDPDQLAALSREESAARESLWQLARESNA